MLRARDLMESDVLTVDPEATLFDVHRLFAEEQISGAPVVDELGSLLGVITASDLVRAVGEPEAARPIEAEYYRENLPQADPDWIAGPDEFQDRLSQLRVSDAMTRQIECVDPDASASEIARRLREKRIHRLLVVKGHQLVGIVTAFDLLRVVEEMKDDVPR